MTGTKPADDAGVDVTVTARILLRAMRSSVRPYIRPNTWWNARLGPISLAEGELVVRPPLPSDAHEFPAPLNWTDQCLRLRGHARRGTAYPHLVLLDGRIVGERLIMIDWGTSTAEESSRIAHESFQVLLCSKALALAHVLSAPRVPRRFVTPVAVPRDDPPRALERLGYRREGTLHALRAGLDHDMWVAYNSAELRARLGEILGS